jgi:AcrR family transcriptional regulator
VSAGDPDTATRIKLAAFEVFATRGFGSSLRDIAERADVSHGLIRHWFGDRDGLRAAVDAYVVDEILAVYRIAADGVSIDTINSRRERVARFLADRPEIAEYVAQLVTTDPAAGQPMFRALVTGVENELIKLASELGAIAFRPMIEEVLDVSFATDEGSLRWNRIAFDLMSHALSPHH